MNHKQIKSNYLEQKTVWHSENKTNLKHNKFLILGICSVLIFFVIYSPILAEAQLTNNTRLTTNGITYDVSWTNDRPLILNNVNLAGTPLIESLYFNHFEYAIKVNIKGKDYRMASSLCPYLTSPTNSEVCRYPKTPFALSSGASTPIQNANTIFTSVEIENLPGYMKIDFFYKIGNAYCGPKAGWLQLTSVGLPGTFKLGGQCMGIAPTYHWIYVPPKDGISGDTIYEFCRQLLTFCDIPDNILFTLRSEKYKVTDFVAETYSTLKANAPNVGEKSTFLKDDTGWSELTKAEVANSIGPMDKSTQIARLKYFSTLDAFMYIKPMMKEKHVFGAMTNLRGEFDNVHLKSENSRGVYFPNCTYVYAADTVCIHVHENWFGEIPSDKPEKLTYSEGQTITWWVLKMNPGEGTPVSFYTIDNKENLVNPTTNVGVDHVLWIESHASSKECGLTQKVKTPDNSLRPCIVMPEPFFYTN